MNTPAKQGFFITGTDTGVGKTLVAVALTRAFVARGLRTAVMKPVAAGVVQTPDGPRNDDALELLDASNVQAPYEDVNPWLLTTPASPHLAARHDGVSISHERILAAHRRLAARGGPGAGRGRGRLARADLRAWRPWPTSRKSSALPVILVVGLRLGCLNHALLTREAIRSQRTAVRRMDRQQDGGGNAAGEREHRNTDEPLRRGAAGRRAGGQCNRGSLEVSAPRPRGRSRPQKSS